MNTESPVPMPQSFYQRQWLALNNRALVWWQWANRVTHNYALYLAQAIKNFATKGQQEAVGFAYWAMFSLFPLLVPLIIIATSILGPRAARLETFAIINQFLPQGGTTLIRDTLDKIIPRQHTATLLSSISLLFGAV